MVEFVLDYYRLKSHLHYRFIDLDSVEILDNLKRKCLLEYQTLGDFNKFLVFIILQGQISMMIARYYSKQHLFR